jgi:Arc/MetJ family transcription regulator
MRTTIDLPADLLARAKRFAAETKRPLRAVIEDALRETLGRRPTATRSAPATLTTFGTSGLQPGVDLDDGAALLDLMDAPGDPPRRERARLRR